MNIAKQPAIVLMFLVVISGASVASQSIAAGSGAKDIVRKEIKGVYAQDCAEGDKRDGECTKK